MRTKIFIIVIALILGVYGGIAGLLLNHELPRVDTVTLNEIRTEVESLVQNGAGNGEFGLDAVAVGL